VIATDCCPLDPTCHDCGAQVRVGVLHLCPKRPLTLTFDHEDGDAMPDARPIAIEEPLHRASFLAGVRAAVAELRFAMPTMRAVADEVERRAVDSFEHGGG
jgi:hypothetical protein